MDNYRSLTHSRYDCKYHVVFVPNFRKKALFGKIRQYLTSAFYELARQKGCEILSGHMEGDHVQMCIEIPPKLRQGVKILSPTEFSDFYKKQKERHRS